VNDYQSGSDSTSAGGSMLRQIREPILVGLILVGFGTSSANQLPGEIVLRARTEQQTTAGLKATHPENSRSEVIEARRLSGLTWDQLARLFNVSRRSVHFWASGKPMTSGNEEHLHRLLAVLRKIDRGSAGSNRSELLAVRESGNSPFDLLVQGRYDLALMMVGFGHSQPRLVSPALSPRAKAARTPRAPEELVGALQDRVHRQQSITRAARSVRVRGGD